MKRRVPVTLILLILLILALIALVVVVVRGPIDAVVVGGVTLGALRWAWRMFYGR